MLVFLFALCAPFSLFTVTTTEKLFEDFVRTYNKTYHNHPRELSKRFEVFKETINRIEKLNKHRNHEDSAVYGVTEYSDLTPVEFHYSIIKRNPKLLNINHKIQKRAAEPVDFKNVTGIPNKKDWRDAGVVSSVKNQDKCGACWAFSTVETVESMSALKTGNLTERSVQQMIDCSTENGCEGGDTCTAIVWLMKNKIFLTTEKLYPFQNDVSDACKFTPSVGVRVTDYSCDNFTGQELEILKLLANHGPVVAAVDASGWQDYLGGIIQFHCDTNRNHAVQIVGYDLTGDIPYYIVRNSWGPKFGLNGYLHIAIGKNLCAIAEEVSAVDVI